MHRPPSVKPDYRRNEGAAPELFTRDGLDVPCRFAKFDALFFSRRDDVANAPAERLRGGAVFENPAGGRLEVDLAHLYNEDFLPSNAVQNILEIVCYFLTVVFYSVIRFNNIR